MTMKLKSFSATDVGKKRDNNEDAYSFCETSLGSLFIVCDGMGGHAAGERASEIAVNTIKEFFHSSESRDIVAVLTESIQHANRNIWEEARNFQDLAGMGTTCVVVFVAKSGETFIAHVGDSRCYYLSKKGELRVLTTDHSYVQFLIETGDVKSEDAFDHPAKNRILKALGVEADIKPTVTQEPFLFVSGDLLLLCTDGLNDMLRDEDIRKILLENHEAESQTKALISSALDAGGKDNVTVTIIQIEESPNVVSESEVLPALAKGKKKSLFGILVFFFVFGLLALFIYQGKFVRHENEPKESVVQDKQVNDSIPQKDSLNINSVNEIQE